MHLADLAQLNSTPRTVRFDRDRLTIEDIVDIAQGRAIAALSDDPDFRAAIARGADFLDRLLREDGTPSCRTTCTPTTASAWASILRRRRRAPSWRRAWPR